MQEWPNRLICHLDYGLGWAKESTSSIVFTSWRQCAHMGRHISATWRIRLNRLSAVAMQSYVKLLWPLVCLVAALFAVIAWLMFGQTAEYFKVDHCQAISTICKHIMLGWFAKKKEILGITRITGDYQGTFEYCSLSIVWPVATAFSCKSKDTWVNLTLHFNCSAASHCCRCSQCSRPFCSSGVTEGVGQRVQLPLGAAGKGAQNSLTKIFFND